MELHTLELAGVSSGYGGKQVLHDITFSAQESAIYVVLGPNGAGKTTLFRTIAGILEPISGRVLFDGEDLSRSKEARNRINYLSHYNAIPEEMTVRGALDFYARIEGGNVGEVLALLGLEDLKDRRISDLSQGQKKRVSRVRADVHILATSIRASPEVRKRDLVGRGRFGLPTSSV